MTAGLVEVVIPKSLYARACCKYPGALHRDEVIFDEVAEVDKAAYGA